MVNRRADSGIPGGFRYDIKLPNAVRRSLTQPGTSYLSGPRDGRELHDYSCSQGKAEQHRRYHESANQCGHRTGIKWMGRLFGLSPERFWRLELRSLVAGIGDGGGKTDH